jgi:hypothetical protein
MKNLVKILILSVLSCSGFAQSTLDLGANEIKINRALRIDQNNSNALNIFAPANTTSNFNFSEGGIYKGGFQRFDDQLLFNFNGGIYFTFGFPIFTGISQTGVYTDGTFQSKQMGFTTTNNAQVKPVFADKSGKLVVDNSANHYQNYHPTAAQATEITAPIRRNAAYAWFNSTNAAYEMLVPLVLPDNVKVTNIRMWCSENSTTANLELNFRKNSNTNQATNTIATVTSSGTSAVLTSINVNTSEVIDNQNFSYYVSISSVGNWDGPNLALHNLVITYQYQ